MARLLGIDEREGQRADALLRRQQDRVATRARHPQRRVRLLHRLRHDVAGRHRDEPAIDARERCLGHAPDGDLETLEPCIPLDERVDAESAELGLRRRLARAELDATARDEVEHGDPLGRARGMVVTGRGLDDAVAEPDVLRALAACGEEHLGRARVGVLLEEVVLDLPHNIEAEPIGQLDLVERVLDQLELAPLVPWPRQLVLEEDAELHAATSALPSAWNSASTSSPFGRLWHQCSTSPRMALRVATRFAPSDAASAASHSVPIISVPA